MKRATTLPSDSRDEDEACEQEVCRSFVGHITRQGPVTRQLRAVYCMYTANLPQASSTPFFFRANRLGTTRGIHRVHIVLQLSSTVILHSHSASMAVLPLKNGSCSSRCRESHAAKQRCHDHASRVTRAELITTVCERSTGSFYDSRNAFRCRDMIPTMLALTDPFECSVGRQPVRCHTPPWMWRVVSPPPARMLKHDACLAG